MVKSGHFETWTKDHGPWTMDHGPWTMDHGPWTMDHGPSIWTIKLNKNHGPLNKKVALQALFCLI